MFLSKNKCLPRKAVLGNSKMAALIGAHAMMSLDPNSPREKQLSLSQWYYKITEPLRALSLVDRCV